MSIKNSLANLLGDLLNKRDLEELSSEERISRMEQIDEQIEVFTDFISELMSTYEALEEEERAYQEKRRNVKDKARSVRNLFRKHPEKENMDELLQLSYDVSAYLNGLRSKARKTDFDNEMIRTYTEILKEIENKIKNS